MYLNVVINLQMLHGQDFDSCISLGMTAV